MIFDHILAGRLDLTKIVTQDEPITDVIEAYEAFDHRRKGWLKVELQPQG
ncbi:hypothetical protein [Micromonospora sp. ALFpr18c]|nr:hypothetical protein [Micromonospora sp. ALFpr18c]